MNNASKKFGVSAYDIATLDKIPVIKRLMSNGVEGLALDIGIGTGYTTEAVFGNRPTVSLDLHAPNLDYYRRVSSTGDPINKLCVVAPAAALPFQSRVFKFILCSEVLEHLEDDDAAVREIARVLDDEGRAVITVPYTGLGFIGFLEICGIKTVHDFPGPERHVRPGYDERSIQDLLGRHGLEVVNQAFYLRLFTKLAVDLVSLAHLIYQRVFHHRRAWTWSDAAEVEDGRAFRFYAFIFPLLRVLLRLDKTLSLFRGFGLVVAVRKRNPM
jgi:SAM-dependent methyltransferase